MYSKDLYTDIQADTIIQGGTGYDLNTKLQDDIEHQYPDYQLYPQFQDTAYGFLTRGCPRNCGFCIVSEKEGRHSYQVADLYEFWQGQKEIKLLDPNLLACSNHERLLIQLAESGARVDFTQGLDIRLINEDNAALLNQVKVKMLHFAWDHPGENLVPFFERFQTLTKIKDKRRKLVYVLCNYGSSHQEDLTRIYTLRDLGFDPFVMIYEKPLAPLITRRLQRWVNNKRIFYTVADFKDYQTSFKRGRANEHRQDQQ